MHPAKVIGATVGPLVACHLLVRPMALRRGAAGKLPAIAELWGLEPEAWILSGDVEQVERALNSWRIPRVRNERTGDLSHPALVYVIGPNGRITYALDGHPDAIVAAVRAIG